MKISYKTLLSLIIGGQKTQACWNPQSRGCLPAQKGAQLYMRKVSSSSLKVSGSSFSISMSILHICTPVRVQRCTDVYRCVHILPRRCLPGFESVAALSGQVNEELREVLRHLHSLSATALYIMSICYVYILCCIYFQCSL